MKEQLDIETLKTELKAKKDSDSRLEMTDVYFWDY